ncbi:MAG: polysaccharide biosynthesis tyrosine autokinase [Deltaproteobacteria bacterium]|nr:polysaccharide biosynthesis tyrosine autokinase [Deltaproteobacteria bacterium]
MSANEKLYTELASKYQEVLIKNAEQIEEVSIIQPALAPGTPIDTTSPFSAVIFLAVLMGVVLGSVLAFIVETVDTSFGAIEDIESFLNLPVLGVIAHIDRAVVETSRKGEESAPTLGAGKEQPPGWERLLLLLAPTAFPSENFRALRTNLDFSCLEKGTKTLLFTSSSDGEGKSTVVTNTALAFAQAGKRTLLIDADLRKSDLHRVFGLEHSPGLSDVILGNTPWQQAIRTITDLVVGKYNFEKFLFAPGMDQLHIMAAGTTVSHPVELLDSRRAAEFLAEVREQYDVILVDSPPVLAVADTVILGSKLDGVIIVYEFGRVGRRALQHAKTQLDNVQAHLYGVVINNLQAEASPDFHDIHYYKSKYGYRYEPLPASPRKASLASGRQWAARFWQLFS